MKTLAGANPDAKPDYRTQALTELNKLESKVILLNEMLDNVDVQRGEQFAQGDVYDVSSSLFKHLRPAILISVTITASSFHIDECSAQDTGLDIQRRGRRPRVLRFVFPSQCVSSL